MIFTGTDVISGIQNWYNIRYPKTKLQSITRTSDGYRVEHTGRDIIKKHGPETEIETVYMDLISNVHAVDNLLQEVQ